MSFDEKVYTYMYLANKLFSTNSGERFERKKWYVRIGKYIQRRKKI